MLFMQLRGTGAEPFAPCSLPAAPGALALSDYRQNIPLGHGIATVEMDGFDGTADRSRQSIFHFHGFQDENGVAFLDGIADLFRIADDAAGAAWAAGAAAGRA